MTEGVAPTSAPAPAPDWSTLSRDILCPLCDYNLRGLIEPRCPECGHRFEWAEMLSDSDRVHPFLFEHQPHRGRWALITTLRASVFAGSFWESVRPNQKPVPRRMIGYWAILIVPALLAAIVPLVMQTVEARRTWNEHRRGMLLSWQANPTEPQIAAIIAQHGSAQRAVDTIFPQRSWLKTLHYGLRRSDRLFVNVLPTVLAMLAWPWLTTASLLIFRRSMTRARIRNGHVLRCVIYSHDVILVLLPILVAVTWFGPYDMFWQRHMIPPLQATLTLLLLLVLGFRLTIAYRQYLRFPHALATVVASQVIVGLALLEAYVLWLNRL